jgi:dienelactone hydrolase
MRFSTARRPWHSAPVWLAGIVCAVAVSARAADLADYTGNYSLGDRILAIAEWEVDAAAPHVLAFTDLASGRFGVLSEAGADEFVLHAGVMAGPEVARLHFVRKDNEMVALIFQAKTATRIRHRRVETMVRSGDVELPATLFLPAGAGPFPAVVIVPAGRVGRMAAATFPNFFLSEGFAVLAYDGRQKSGPIEERASDAIAAAQLLRGRSDVDGKRIGLWGHSQGGWLSIVAASKSPDIAFVIDHSGMFVPAWQQELYRVAAEGGFSVDAAEAMAFETRMMDVARSGKGWDELASALANAHGAWTDLVYKPASLEELQRVWRDDFSFDPRPFAARVKQPVLALFGGLDRSTPMESAANLKHAMPADARLTEMFFATADHAFLDAVTGGNAEIPTLTRFVPGMFDAMRTWLRSVSERAHRRRG